MSVLHHRMEELETKLKGVRMVLQEKVQQLKEQVSPLCMSSCLLGNGGVSHAPVLSAAGKELPVQRPAEGALRGELPAGEGAAGHRAAAEEGREEELPAGGEGQRAQPAAARRCPRLARHLTPLV